MITNTQHKQWQYAYTKTNKSTCLNKPNSKKLLEILKNILQKNSEFIKESSFNWLC